VKIPGMKNRQAGAPITEVRDLTKRFGTLTALDSLSFAVCRGIILGFLAHFLYKFNLLTVGPGLVLFVGSLLQFVWPRGFLPWRLYSVTAARQRRLSGGLFLFNRFQLYFSRYRYCRPGFRSRKEKDLW